LKLEKTDINEPVILTPDMFNDQSDFKITIVVPLFNKSFLTQNFLNNLLANTSSAHDLILVDNASTDDTYSMITGYKNLFEEKNWKFQIIRNEKNLGFGSAMNQGARQASVDSKYLALLNNDTWQMPGWDIKLVSCIEQTDAGLISPFIIESEFYDEDQLVKRAEDFVQANKGKKRVQFNGAFMFFNKQIFLELGMFDELFFLTFEDTDLQYRMDAKNIPYYLVGDSLMWHQSSGSQRQIKDLSQIHLNSLNTFIAKWGFDPRPAQSSYREKIKNKYYKLLAKFNKITLF
jgi:O-antigen biosynthesis protein